MIEPEKWGGVISFPIIRSIRGASTQADPVSMDFHRPRFEPTSVRPYERREGNMHPDSKGKGKAGASRDRPSSLLDPDTGALPKHDPAYVPPAHQLKKYLYAQPHLLHAHPPLATAAEKKNGAKRKRVGASRSADVKLEHHLAHLSATAKASSHHAHEHDDLLLPSDNHGLIETESALERTWRITQGEIVEASNVAAADKRFSLSLPDFGPYAVDYTRNGRHLAIAGRKGHVGTFDWANSGLHSELHLNETVRDVKWLHDESFYAVAQKKYVYIYDKQGLEVHQLRSHIEVNRMEFLPYHFLLATIVSFSGPRP